MRLSAGHRLGAYEVLSPLGAGGMGEVYRARDTRLGREVAIKVLPTDRLTDERRKRRFVQEARAASALNHPNIVTIHEIESADGADFIVMEYVPGKTLDALIRQRMRLAEVLRIAVPIADALARAHAAGIVHRDLKPANVVVTPEGVVKVLDFGLAKLLATDEASDESDTATQDSPSAFVSAPGTIAGTPAYMSPEQASGANTDARSDVFSFGSVLYEMATGRRAFGGGSRAETLSVVLHAQPRPPSETGADLPTDLEKLILRCLRKEPAKRFQHMADVKVLLDEIRDDFDSAPAAVAVPRDKRALLLVGAMAAVLVVGAFLATRRLRAPTPPAPQVIPLTATSGSEWWPTFSPDGNQIAFAWDGEVTQGANAMAQDWDIWLKMIGSSETRRLTTGPARDCCPSWSPDGRQIAFTRQAGPDFRNQRGGAGPSGRIYVVSPLGVAERKVSDFAAVTSSLAWSPDGRWLVAAAARAPGDTRPGAGALHSISLETGETRAITIPEPAGYDASPALSPDGTRLAYASCGFWWSPPCDVRVVELAADLMPHGALRRLVRLPDIVRSVAWSHDGRSVIYSAEPNTFNKGRLWRVDAAGDRPPERLELAPQGAASVAVSPLRDRLAFTLERGSYANVFRFEPGRPPTPALASPGGDTSPNFSPDGRRIAFMSARSAEFMEIWLADADGSSPVQLTHGPGSHQGTPRFSPDGRRIVFESRGDDGFSDLWTVDPAGGPPRRVTDGRFHNGRASWSRDGRFLYYREDRADGRDILRIPEAGGTPERVTRNGGHFARPSADGRWLYYTKTDPISALFRLELPSGPEQQVVDCIRSVSLDAGPDAMYYVGCEPDRSEASVYRLETASGRPQLLGRLPPEYSQISGLAVSPDAKTILFSSNPKGFADLMLIENFR